MAEPVERALRELEIALRAAGTSALVVLPDDHMPGWLPETDGSLVLLPHSDVAADPRRTPGWAEAAATLAAFVGWHAPSDVWGARTRADAMVALAAVTGLTVAQLERVARLRPDDE